MVRYSLLGVAMKYIDCNEKKQRGRFDFPAESYYVDPSHPQYTMPFHWHMECEFIHIIKGSFPLSLGSETKQLQENECLFIPGGVIHGGSPEDCIYECLVFDLEHFLHSTSISKEVTDRIINKSNRYQYSNENNPQCNNIVIEMFKVMKEKLPGYEYITTGLIWKFVGTIIQLHLYKENEKDEIKNDKRAEQMKNVLIRIKKDYASPITLNDLAGEAAMAPKYFCKIFRQVTGRTPIDYLNYYRIECACELLCNTNSSVTEIALSCGFNDLSYFVKQFRRHKNISAKEYRKQYAVDKRK